MLEMIKSICLCESLDLEERMVLIFYLCHPEIAIKNETLINAFDMKQFRSSRILNSLIEKGFIKRERVKGVFKNTLIIEKIEILQDLIVIWSGITESV